MPKLKINGKVKHFPYTKKGVKSAKKMSSMSGGKLMISSKKMKSYM